MLVAEAGVSSRTGSLLKLLLKYANIGLPAVCGSVVRSGTILQAARSRIRFPIRSFDFSIDLTLPTALWLLGRFNPSGRFLVLISLRGWTDPRTIVRLEGLGQLKNPMTSSEIELAT
jgi:hypothetical protein